MTEEKTGVTNSPRYQIVCPNGNRTGNFASAQEAAFWARGMWPDMDQDETRSGAGWDVEVVGSTPLI